MKHRNFWLRMIPVAIMVVVTIIMSVNIFSKMLKSEEEICWQRLEVATSSTAKKIEIRMKDNLSFLKTVGDAYISTDKLDDLKSVGDYLSAVMSQTVFDRIDIILPDESIITQEGIILSRGGESTFDALAKKGTHVTGRITSSFTGEEVICCVSPIKTDNEVAGLLVGTINCSTLSKAFEVITYGEAAQLFLIDRTDGDYILDNLHDSFGNINNLGLRQKAYSDEMIDMTPVILSGEPARLAFVSNTNGENSYQYSMAVEGFNWTICIAVQEDVAFANLNNLKNDFFEAGLVGIFVIVVYVLWNVILNMTAAKSEEELKKLEYERIKNDARATFISNMSHDIRTPLNGIIGMLQIIKNHNTDKALVNDCLEKIEISAQYLSTLTGDMLDISEIERNKLVMPEEPVDLRKLADELTSMMEKQAKDSGVSYSIELSQLKNHRIIGSSVHIKRILVNLIGNAIKYSKNEGRKVWFSISDEPMVGEDNRRLYRFVVKDNGIGMSKEFQKNMYIAFEQETIDARSEYQGYGLGLTIASHLIRKMGGIIDLDSEKGVGSTFTVSIPFLSDSEKDVQKSDEADEINLAGMRLLLVEDNEFNMEIAGTLLTDAGATVDAAINGKIAVEMFADSKLNTYDAIIMDVMMPEMDGCEATRVIRSMERSDSETVPIIAMTASTFSEDVERCMASGMNTHLAKPIVIEKLVAVLKAFRK